MYRIYHINISLISFTYSLIALMREERNFSVLQLEYSFRDFVFCDFILSMRRIRESNSSIVILDCSRTSIIYLLKNFKTSLCSLNLKELKDKL